MKIEKQNEENEIRINNTILSEKEKELLEHDYIQCSLQISSDLFSRGESFIPMLQKMALKNDKFELAKKKIRAKVNQLELATKTEFGEHAKMELEWVLSLLEFS